MKVVPDRWPQQRLIAYLEMGHTLIGTLVKDHDPVQKVTLIPRGQAQGLTWFSPDEEQTLVTRASSRPGSWARWGRAADVVFGHQKVTTGAGGDIQQVASMARPMVTRFGMSDLGPIALEGGQEVFLGRDLMSRSDISESISQAIDEQVRGMVKRCYEETVAVVADNREAMDRLVELLIEKETMDGEEFAAVVAEFTQVPEKDRTVVTLD